VFDSNKTCLKAGAHSQSRPQYNPSLGKVAFVAKIGLESNTLAYYTKSNITTKLELHSLKALII